MRNLYILSALFSIIFLASTLTQAADHSYELTSCTGSMTTTNSDDDISGSITQTMAEGDTCRLSITIDNVNKISITITASLGTNDVLTIAGTNISDDTDMIVESNTFTIFFDNAGTAKSNFNISWTGIFDITPTITPVACKGESTGAISIVTSGDTYSWTTNPSGYTSSSKDISGLAPGNYLITVSNADGCKGNNDGAEYTVTEPTSALAFSLPTITHIKCYTESTGAINITPTGGTPDYIYSWTGSNGGVITTSTSQDQTNLHAGKYEVTVTDANSCTNTANFTLTQPADAVSITYNSTGSNLALNCNGDNEGVINTSVGGGTTPYTYSWNPSGKTTQNAEDLTAEDYTVTITDNNGCTASLAKTITQPSEIKFNSPGRVNRNGYDISCYGGNNGELEANPTGGTGSYTYSWNGGSTLDSKIATELVSGYYTITVTDGNNCVKSNTLAYEITEPNELTLNLPGRINYNGFDITCFEADNGQLEAIHTGGAGSFTYSWNDTFTQTSKIATNLSPGTNYIVTVKDGNNCTISNSTAYEITEPTKLTLNLPGKIDYNGFDITCFGDDNGRLETFHTGGVGSYTYSWNDAFTQTSKIATNLSPGANYIVTVKDGNNCTVSNSTAYEITEPTELTLKEGSGSKLALTCHEDSIGEINIDISGGASSSYTFNWSSNPGGLISDSGLEDQPDLKVGKYTVRAWDINSCLASLPEFEITAPDPISVTFVSKIDIDCNGDNTGAIDISIAGGNSKTITWSSPNGSGFVKHDIDQTGLSAGDYTAFVSDNKGCAPTTLNTTLTEKDIISVSLNSQTNINCYGNNNGSIDIDATGGNLLNYTWSSDDGGKGFVMADKNQSTLTAATYKVIVNDDKGCSPANTEIIIIEPDELILLPPNLVHISSYGESDGEITATHSGGTSPYEYQWNDLLTQTTKTATVLIKGSNYTVTVTDVNGCDNNNTANPYILTEPDELLSGEIKINNSHETYTCEGDSVFYFAQKTIASGGTTPNNYEFSWEYSTGGSNWQSIVSGQTDSSYTWNSKILQDVYVRRIVSDGVTTAVSNTIFLDFIAKTPLSISNLQAEYCFNSDTIQLIGSPANSQGVFSGDGILSNTDGIADFLPKENDTVSNPIIITYTYIEHGCLSVIKDSTIVRAVPSPSFSIPSKILLGTSHIIDDETPSGGIFSGEGVTSDGIIYTSNLTIGGFYKATYEVSNKYECVGSVSVPIDVIDTAGVFYLDAALTIKLGDNNNNILCFDGNPFTIYAKPIFKHTSGSFEAPISNIGSKKGTLYPSSFSGNSNNRYIIKYNYSGPEGNFVFNKEVIVYDMSNRAVITDFKSEYCNYQQIVNVKAKELTDGDLGRFEGYGISDNDNLDEVAELNINLASTYPQPIQLKYIYTHNISGCKDSIIEPVTISNLGILTVKFNDQTCSNSLGDTIVGNPRGGEFEGLSSNAIITGINDSILFTPNANIVGENTIKYTYTNPSNGCTNSIEKTITIDSLPNLSVEFNIPEKGFCYINNETDITGIANSLVATNGVFEGNGIVDEIQNNGKSLFNPLLAEVGDHNIVFAYTDNKGCKNTHEFTVKVNKLPEISISGYNDSYCIDWDSPIDISGYPKTGISTFTIGSKQFNNTSNYNLLIQDYNQNDTLTITYKNIDNNGCINIDTVNIEILDLPSSNFIYKNICISDPINFEYTGSTPLNKVDSFYWEIGKIITSKEVNPTHKFDIAGNTTVKLTVTDTNSCASNSSQVLALENNPIADFSWKFECINNDGVEFNPIGIEQPTYDYTWDFGDNTTSTEFSPIKKYNKIGAYTIKYTVASNPIISTCKSTVTNTIYIKPNHSISDLNYYFESFETDAGFWIPKKLDTANYSWESGIPNGTIINTTAHSSVNAYVTNLNGFYNSNEKSAVISPCFDFTEAKKPMISMSIFKQLENDHDGAIFEYTTDAGDTWNNIGTVDEGINWYNSFSITAEPGAQNGKGWTDSVSTWIDSHYYLDDLIGENSVQFRVAFAADAAVEYEGFAFDNIRIGERERRVLIEHFTNTENTNAINSDNIINNLVNNHPLDAIDIQYHTSFYSNDALYRNYPSGSSSREAYYGVNSIPYSYIDGSFVDFTSNNKSNEIKLKKQILIEPKFNMNIESDQDQTKISIKIKINAREQITDRQLQLFVAVVETIELESGKVLKSVLRKFLPNPGGIYLNSNWGNGDAKVFRNEYSIDDYVAFPDSLVIIAFIQDEITKEILQTVTNKGVSNPISSIEPWLSNTDALDFLIYPNPANQKVYFSFGKNPSSNSTIHIINQTGKVVDYINIIEGDSSIHYETSQLPEGIYYIRWTDNYQQKIKKLIVIH